jgi:D-alanyl-D-alanine carboxypeptidase
MLTALIAVDWLPANALVPVSEDAANAYPDRVGMKAGQYWPLGITLRSLLIYSANDAAYALAERISGTLDDFGSTMQMAAQQIGLQDHPVLHDPAGLDGTEGVDGGNRISAWDLATLGRVFMANPTLASIVGMQSYAFTGPDGSVFKIYSQNLYFLQNYAGAIGVKTGYTDAAGFCVVEEAVRDGRHMLAVVLNGESSYQTAEDLLNRGFATPVGAESDDPELPAVHQPEPPAPPPIHVAAAPRPAPKHQSIASSFGLEATILVIIAGGTLVASRRLRRTSRRELFSRRRRPGVGWNRH